MPGVGFKIVKDWPFIGDFFALTVSYSRGGDLRAAYKAPEIFVCITFLYRLGDIKSDGNRKHLADSIRFSAENVHWDGIIMKTAKNLSCLGVNYANAGRQRGNARLKLHFHTHK